MQNSEAKYIRQNIMVHIKLINVTYVCKWS